MELLIQNMESKEKRRAADSLYFHWKHRKSAALHIFSTISSPEFFAHKLRHSGGIG